MLIHNIDCDIGYSQAKKKCMPSAIYFSLFQAYYHLDIDKISESRKSIELKTTN